MSKHNKETKTDRVDKSQKISQRDKINSSFEIKEFNWTDKQKEFIKLALDKNTKVIICNGPPGVGKTLLSVYCCLEMLRKKSISDIIFYRNPIESSSKSLGYLSGSYEEKISPYGEPLNDHLIELLDKASIKSLYSDKRISIESIGFAKGRTHHVKGVICEESEDLTVQELELIMGRMGKFSKLFIIGDHRQSNIKNSGFTKVLDLFKDDESIQNGIVSFSFGTEDCMRNSILKFIIERFEKLCNGI